MASMKFISCHALLAKYTADNAAWTPQEEVTGFV